MTTFEVRLKQNGRLFSRHYHAKNGKQAAQRANGKGKILSVRKVKACDIIGTVESMGLKDIIGAHPRNYATSGVVFDNTSVDEILFPKKGQLDRVKRRMNDEKKKEKDIL